MKIYVTVDKERKIEGFHVISLEEFDQEMSKIIPNSSELIVLEDLIDFVPHNLVQKLINVVCSKLRKNGNISITGFDLGLITRYVLSGDINEEQYSEIISSRSSIHNTKTICNYLKDVNITIENATIEGIKYEIYGKR